MLLEIPINFKPDAQFIFHPFPSVPVCFEDLFKAASLKLLVEFLIIRLPCRAAFVMKQFTGLIKFGTLTVPLCRILMNETGFYVGYPWPQYSDTRASDCRLLPPKTNIILLSSSPTGTLCLPARHGIYERVLLRTTSFRADVGRYVRIFL